MAEAEGFSEVFTAPPLPLTHKLSIIHMNIPLFICHEYLPDEHFIHLSRTRLYFFSRSGFKSFFSGRKEMMGIRNETFVVVAFDGWVELFFIAKVFVQKA